MHLLLQNLTLLQGATDNEVNETLKELEDEARLAGRPRRHDTSPVELISMGLDLEDFQ